MGLFTKEQEEKFVIICEKVFPEFMLRKAENDNLLGIVFSDEKADMYSVLYKYDCDFLNFVLGRLHYYVVMWFENNNNRLYKGNSYLTVESRREIKSFVLIFGYFEDFFSRNGISFEIEKLYKKKILEVDEIISRVKCREVNLPDDYQPIEKNIIDEPIFRIKKKYEFSNAKYLVFGVSKTKPDIRIKQVIDGDLEVVNSDDMLVYDQEIGDSLLYKEFNDWWKRNSKKYCWYETKKQLQEKERVVQNFYKANYCAENHPVLIPQVYLHFDPKSKEERKKCKFSESLIFQRMDFLIIYKGKRIVIEIDGYSHLMTNGKIDMEKYSQQLEYDRTMKFLGYDIFRICNCELEEKNFEKTLDCFFKNLYTYLGIEQNELKNVGA